MAENKSENKEETDNTNVEEDPSLEYEKQRLSFITDLKRFNANRGTPFDRIPEIGGCEIDLYNLYQRVTTFGGWQKVNFGDLWEDFVEDFNLPNGCVNAAQALKNIYFRYLNLYEKVNFFGEDPGVKDHDEEDGPSRKKICLPIETIPLTYNYNQHNLSETQREKNNLTTDLYVQKEYEKLEMSLRSGLPNEVDMAINVCVLLSTEGRHCMKLEKTYHLLRLLMAHVAVFEEDAFDMQELYHKCWMPNADRNFLRFWFETVTHPIAKPLITFAGRQYSQKEMVGGSVLNLGRDLGTLDSEGQRALQLAVFLHNLSFEEANQKILSKEYLVQKFLMLSIHSSYDGLRQIALDTLSNLSCEISISGLTKIGPGLLIDTLNDALFSDDRFFLVRGMEMLGKLSQVGGNEDILVEQLRNDTYSRLVDLLTVQDIQLIVHTLEALYRLSKIGEPFTSRIARVHKAITTLVSLITIEAQSFGPGSLVGIKVVEYIPPAHVGSDGEVDASRKPTTVIQPINPDSINIYQVPAGSLSGQASSSDKNAAAKQVETPKPPPPPPTDIHATTSSWLNATYELKKKSKVNQVELFSEYLQFCRRFQITNAMSSADFLHLVKVIFHQCEVISINRKNGDNDVFLDGLCKRSTQKPFAVTTLPPEKGASTTGTAAATPIPSNQPSPSTQSPANTPTSTPKGSKGKSQGGPAALRGTPATQGAKVGKAGAKTQGLAPAAPMPVPAQHDPNTGAGGDPGSVKSLLARKLTQAGGVDQDLQQTYSSPTTIINGQAASPNQGQANLKPSNSVPSANTSQVFTSHPPHTLTSSLSSVNTQQGRFVMANAHLNQNKMLHAPVSQPQLVASQIQDNTNQNSNVILHQNLNTQTALLGGNTQVICTNPQPLPCIQQNGTLINTPISSLQPQQQLQMQLRPPNATMQVNTLVPQVNSAVPIPGTIIQQVNMAGQQQNIPVMSSGNLLTNSLAVQGAAITQAISSPAVAALLTSTSQQGSPQMIISNSGVPQAAQVAQQQQNANTVVIQTTPGTIVMPQRQVPQGTVSFIVPPQYRQGAPVTFIQQHSAAGVPQSTGAGINMVPSLGLPNSGAVQPTALPGQQIVLANPTQPALSAGGMQISSLQGNTILQSQVVRMNSLPQPQQQNFVVHQAAPATQLLPLPSSVSSSSSPSTVQLSHTSAESQLTRSEPAVPPTQQQQHQPQCNGVSHDQNVLQGTVPLKNQEVVSPASLTKPEQVLNGKCSVVGEKDPDYLKNNCLRMNAKMNGVVHTLAEQNRDGLSSQPPLQANTNQQQRSTSMLVNGCITSSTGQAAQHPNIPAQTVHQIRPGGVVNGVPHPVGNGGTANHTQAQQFVIQKQNAQPLQATQPTQPPRQQLHFPQLPRLSLAQPQVNVVQQGNTQMLQPQTLSNMQQQQVVMRQPQAMVRPRLSTLSSTPHQNHLQNALQAGLRPTAGLPISGTTPAEVSNNNGSVTDITNKQAGQQQAVVGQTLTPAAKKRAAPVRQVTTATPEPITRLRKKKPGTNEVVVTPANAQARRQAQGKPVHIAMQYMCEWGSCRKCFSTARLVLIHVFKHHVPRHDSSCQWAACEKLVRKRWSLISHIQDAHCTEMAMRVACQRRYTAMQQKASGVTPTPPPPPPTPMIYPPDAAMQAIRRFAVKQPYSEFAEPREGPVSKHIRLTSALILRNICHSSSYGRRLIRQHEEILSYNTMNLVESSTALSNCLWELVHLCDSNPISL